MTFELSLERWVGFDFVEVKSLGDGAGRERAFQWGFQDAAAAANELFLFVELEDDHGYDVLHSS